MKRAEVEVPDHATAEMKALIADGWFRSEAELVE
jgi:Arc/MetJ-type ribon-helix-helix transcriptional regulator